MASKGTAFWWDGHVWFVLTDPFPADGKVICVNLTTCDEECPDDECFMTTADYAWIKPNHPTVVAFSRLKLLDPLKIDASLRSGQIKAASAVPQPTIVKVLESAKRSREIGAAKKLRLI